jgi:hypothetical protein
MITDRLRSYGSALNANSLNPKFRVIAFFTAKQDQAHISFVHEANRWFPEIAAKFSAMRAHPTGRISIQTFLPNIRWLFFWIVVPKIRHNELRLELTWSVAERGWAFTLLPLN